MKEYPYNCVELAGKLQTRLTKVNVPGLGTTVGVLANAGRIAVRISMNSQTTPGTAAFTAVGYVAGGVFVALGAVSPESPVCDLSIDTVGPDMLGALNFQGSGDTMVVTVCEVILIR